MTRQNEVPQRYTHLVLREAEWVARAVQLHQTCQSGPLRFNLAAQSLKNLPNAHLNFPPFTPLENWQ